MILAASDMTTHLCVVAVRPAAWDITRYCVA